MESTAALRKELRAQMAAMEVARASSGGGPKWLLRWRRRNAQRYWGGALADVNSRDHDEHL